MLTSKVALEATSREPCAPGATKTRLKLSLKTGLRKVSVCTTMPPVMSTTGFISASPTCRHMPVSKQVTMFSGLSAITAQGGGLCSPSPRPLRAYAAAALRFLCSRLDIRLAYRCFGQLSHCIGRRLWESVLMPHSNSNSSVGLL